MRHRESVPLCAHLSTLVFRTGAYTESVVRTVPCPSPLSAEKVPRLISRDFQDEAMPWTIVVRLGVQWVASQGGDDYLQLHHIRWHHPCEKKCSFERSETPEHCSFPGTRSMVTDANGYGMPYHAYPPPPLLALSLPPSPHMLYLLSRLLNRSLYRHRLSRLLSKPPGERHPPGSTCVPFAGKRPPCAARRPRRFVTRRPCVGPA